MTATTSLMPAAFIGQGSPMNTLEVNRYTSAWRHLGRTLPRPRAVLAVSAHWTTHGSAVTAMRRPRVIHDFYGFPQALFEVDYPAPGSPEVAQEVADVVRPGFVGLDHDSWGIDHGTWSVLAHVFPRADVPVVQLSLHAGAGLRYHLELGERLAPLRERGIFILGSGNVVHNLRRIDWNRPDGAHAWGERFDADVKRLMTSAPGDILAVEGHADYASSVPTTEHFLPLLYLAGLCQAAGQAAEVLVEGGTLGSITMTSYLLGCAGLAPAPPHADPAAALPDPGTVPPEQTNT
ncbi:MAG TPA: 4,5-DOPA dioxygenase extradiol [Caldimonas sp.]|jgi:4,5-DOPA dioxygenase extradiol|nr:4,5-DOPA dioxygenase extradiol [Caldimonas sp.]HEX2541375.1 4,5-DOPA dioxygenase extradiol [Caldimonas sp.]